MINPSFEMTPPYSDSSNAPTLHMGFYDLSWPWIEENNELEELRLDIGDDLFYSLSKEDKQFILETEGIIDLGRKLNEKDFKNIEKSLREGYEY